MTHELAAQVAFLALTSRGIAMIKTIALAKSRGTGGTASLIANLAARPWASLAMRLAVQTAVEAEQSSKPIAPSFDLVIECWSPQSLASEIMQDSELRSHAFLDVRTSEEVVAKGATPSAIGRTPGLSQLTFLSAAPGMSRATCFRHWSEHVPLALEIHSGMNRYVQDRLSPTDGGAVDWFGMAHLHFPDPAALRDGLFRSAEDVLRITDDVAQFVSAHTTVLAVEHVLKI